MSYKVRYVEEGEAQLVGKGTLHGLHIVQTCQSQVW